MSSVLADPETQQDGVPGDGFDVLTTTYDRFRAALRVRGGLDAASAPVLAEVIAGHLRAGRRFVRLDVLGVRIGDPRAARVLLDAHRSLLAAKGTLILTGVTRALQHALEQAGVANDLFAVPVCAHERAEGDQPAGAAARSLGST